MRQLKQPARDWVRDTTADPDYPLTLKARNPLVYARLVRIITVGPPGAPVRTELPVGPNDQFVVARTIIEKAAGLATRRVEEFIEGIVRGDF